MKIRSIDVNASFKPETDSWSGYDGVIITFDDNTQLKFGINDSQDCCEQWGYLHSVDEVEEFIGAEYLGYEERNTWPEQVKESECDMGGGGGFQAIDVKTSNGVMQFVVYNSHNGYYSHSTILIVGDTVKQERL